MNEEPQKHSVKVPSARIKPVRRVMRLVTGKPLRTSDASTEQIGVVEGLPALSLDAITSVAYGPEAIVVVLAVAGLTGLQFMLPVTAVIVLLLVLLVFSYRQVISGYPMGGGAYAVSRDNFGKSASQVAAASLVVDYVLTVAVSIAAGIGALTSAFPILTPHTVPLSLLMLAIITAVNLRGLGTAARAFLIPTAIFILGLFTVVIVGLLHPLGPTPEPFSDHALGQNIETVSVLLLLKAFASGCSALTGVEAIANGVPLFREPRVKRAQRTELALGFILGALLLGLATLASRFEIGPQENQTVLSQIMDASVGRGWIYYVVAIAIVVELGLAANTSFGGLPILLSLLARDKYLPRYFSLRNDRLVYSRGVWVLALLAGILLIAVSGNTNSLIPLYAIGVFTGFTLAQSGMVLYWRRHRPPRWKRRALLNGLGAFLTLVATLVFILTKFTEGGWVVVVTIPLCVVLFRGVERYYQNRARELAVNDLNEQQAPRHTVAVVPVMSPSRLTRDALTTARSLADKVIAVNVMFPEDADNARELQQEWIKWHSDTRLEILRTEYHSLERPLVRFVDSLVDNDERVVVVIPVLIPRHWYHRIFQGQADFTLSKAFTHRPNVLVTRSYFDLKS
ncbi:APC family permease [Lysinibacter sp. HNR]|uniref:APC family permease n=1 Tax=Lysinibacter sp. HNR TaxID=3031408 RepID=UPI0024360C77|nr:APC family permease [Lysinibacter sp. HNR]WGD36372.1 APC family permease [Lysinibacter sp. HNR]